MLGRGRVAAQEGNCEQAPEEKTLGEVDSLSPVVLGLSKAKVSDFLYVCLVVGVPQGIVIGPNMFILIICVWGFVSNISFIYLTFKNHYDKLFYTCLKNNYTYN